MRLEDMGERPPTEPFRWVDMPDLEDKPDDVKVQPQGEDEEPPL